MGGGGLIFWTKMGRTVMMGALVAAVGAGRGLRGAHTAMNLTSTHAWEKKERKKNRRTLKRGILQRYNLAMEKNTSAKKYWYF